MITVLREKRSGYQQQLVQEIKAFHYRFTRYHIDYSIALAYISEEDGDLSACAKYLRDSDSIVFFEKNFCALIFDNTNEEHGIKAASNILSRVQNLFFAKHLYMAVITSSIERSDFQMIHDLFDLAAYALDHHMDNLVVDVSQVILD